MPSKSRKSLRQVYASSGSALTLTAEDFGLTVCKKTGRLIPIKECKEEEGQKNEEV